MSGLEQLLSSYGYPVLLIGTFLEGETILIVGGFLAHRGYLELDKVILCAFLGTVAGDQLFFFLGRVRGLPFIDRRPAWQARSVRVRQLLERHQTAVVLGFRFLYGLRTLTPFLLGASGIGTARFVLLNLLGAALWAVVVGTAGYVLGQTLEALLAEIRHLELVIVAALFAVGLGVWLFHLLRRRRPRGR